LAVVELAQAGQSRAAPRPPSRLAPARPWVVAEATAGGPRDPQHHSRAWHGGDGARHWQTQRPGAPRSVEQHRQIETSPRFRFRFPLHIRDKNGQENMVRGVVQASSVRLSSCCLVGPLAVPCAGKKRQGQRQGPEKGRTSPGLPSFVSVLPRVRWHKLHPPPPLLPARCTHMRESLRGCGLCALDGCLVTVGCAISERGQAEGPAGEVWQARGEAKTEGVGRCDPSGFYEDLADGAWDGCPGLSVEHECMLAFGSWRSWDG
jgi:hypothetical protein